MNPQQIQKVAMLIIGFSFVAIIFFWVVIGIVGSHFLEKIW